MKNVNNGGQSTTMTMRHENPSTIGIRRSPTSSPERRLEMSMLNQLVHQSGIPSSLPTSDAALRSVPGSSSGQVTINVGTGNAQLQVRTYKKTAKDRKRRPWGDEETQCLLLGVERYGAGHWKEILSDPDFTFDNRTNLDLKDRYRTVIRRESDHQGILGTKRVGFVKILEEKLQNGHVFYLLQPDQEYAARVWVPERLVPAPLKVAFFREKGYPIDANMAEEDQRMQEYIRQAMDRAANEQAHQRALQVQARRDRMREAQKARKRLRGEEGDTGPPLTTTHLLHPRQPGGVEEMSLTQSPDTLTLVRPIMQRFAESNEPMGHVGRPLRR